jgi:hypothetical protein
MSDEHARLIGIVEKISGRRNVTFNNTVNFDLKIEGDDAVDLIENIHREFGSSFNGMDMRKFFKDEGIEAALGFWRMGKLPLSVGHLLKVVEKGSWFEPAK